MHLRHLLDGSAGTLLPNRSVGFILHSLVNAELAAR